MIGSWNWRRPLKSLLFIYITVSVVACTISNKLIFHPPPPSYDADDTNLVILDPGDEQVAAYHFPPAAGEKVLMWGHGNAEDIGLLKPILAEVHEAGFGVLAYDYPGYGHSAGSPGEKSCYRAADRAWDFLVDEQGIDPARIVLLGQSIGSGPACRIAERERAGGLVLISPILSAFRTVTRIPLFPGDKFPNLRRMKHIDEPLLVIHGTRDEAVPFSHGRRLFREHRGPKQFLEIPGAGHNDIWFKGRDEMIRAIRQLVSEQTGAQ